MSDAKCIIVYGVLSFSSNTISNRTKMVAITIDDVPNTKKVNIE